MRFFTTEVTTRPEIDATVQNKSLVAAGLPRVEGGGFMIKARVIKGQSPSDPLFCLILHLRRSTRAALSPPGGATGRLTVVALKVRQTLKQTCFRPQTV